MQPIIFSKSKDYSQDLHYNISLEWIFHHTPYGYMEGEGWLKAMNQFSNVCGDSPVNNHILLFDWHNIHFDDGELSQMM